MALSWWELLFFEVLHDHMQRLLPVLMCLVEGHGTSDVC